MEEEGVSQRMKTVGDYKHGSIKRIKLTRFLTYSAVEFCPGPRLNMVVGPNGSGKSSVLCAICLGLGGEPRLLGRADKVEAFVQNGETDAEIELEISNERGDDVIVTRAIRKSDSNDNGKNNKSSVFTWNGDLVSGKKVRDRASSMFQIELDNLCTFLPQEKVGNFSGINSKDLLLETEKTLSDDQDLYNTHMKLVKMQEDLQGGDNQVENLREKVRHLEDEVALYKSGVDKLQERKKAEEHADLLRKKILWLRVDLIRERCMELKHRKEDAKKEVEGFEDQLEPLELAHNKARERLEKSEREVSAFDKDIKTQERNMEKQKTKYDNHDDQIEETLAELASIDSTRAKYETNAQVLREKVEALQQALDQQTPMSDLEEAFEKARLDQESIRSRYNQSKQKLQQLQRDLSPLDENLSIEKRKLDRLLNEKEQRRNHVLRQSQFRDAKKSYDWIQNNRSVFRREVIGPIACEISPESDITAAYLEQHVPNSLLKSFVVQCKSDYDLLYQKIRVEKNIPVNIIQVDRVSRNEPRVFSEKKMDHLRKEHGVRGYLDELFEGPELVIQAVKSNSAAHKVLVGDDQTQDSLDNRDLGDILSESQNTGDNRLQSYCIFTSKRGKSFKYTSQISRYSGKPSLRVDDIKPARFLSRGASDDAKQKVARTLKELEDSKNAIQPELEKTAREQQELLGEVQNSQQRAKSAKAQIQMIQRSVAKLENTKRKLKDAEDKLESDNAEAKIELVERLKQRVLVSLKAMDAHSEGYRKVMDATVKASGAKLNKELTTVQERMCQEKVLEVTRLMEEYKQRFRNIKQQFSVEKNKFKEISARANDVAPLEDEDRNPTVLKDRLMVELAQFDSIGLAEAALEEAEAKLRDIHSDPNVERLYEEKKRELEDANDALDDLTTRKDKRRSELERMTVPWFETLKKTISTVDTRFTKYMSELGCVGGVSLKYDNDPAFSFKDYAVEIKVSFRANVAPTVLSSRVQSGGERSVSTIMYLMAMQDMMVSPFRCVDEINQGLDERNERLVFKRIVQNSTQAPGPGGPTDHCGQYWLITPKLLPNLNDMEVEAMNVICIFNGPYNLENPLDWSTKELIAMRKRRDENHGAEGEDGGHKRQKIES